MTHYKITIGAGTTTYSYLITRITEINRAGVEVRFLSPEDEALRNFPAVILPAFNEAHNHFISNLAGQPLTQPIIGLVSDCSGISTYLAIKSGAISVINLQLSPESLGRALSAILRTCLASQPVNSTNASHTINLLNIAAGPLTVREMAEYLHCSERTMYRRLRELYNQVKVRTRADLRSGFAAGSLHS